MIGLPIGLVTGLKYVSFVNCFIRLSPDFFYRCEASYPKTIAFLRRYLPLNWPEPSPSTEIEEEEDGPITVVLKEDELEQPIRDLLRSIDETDKIDGVELERIVSVLLAAREMLFEEKRRIEADICLLPQVKEENVSSEESNEESATVEEGSTEETVVDVEELHPEEPAEWHVTTSEEAKEGEWGFISLIEDVKEELTELKEVRQEIRDVFEEEVKELVNEVPWKEYEEKVIERIETVIHEIRQIEAKEKEQEVMERAVMVIEEGKQVVEKERSITECECVPDSEQTCTESDQSSSEPEQSSPEPTLSSEQPITETESSQSQDFTDWEHAQIVLEQARSTLLTPSILSQVESAVRDQVTSLTSQLHSSLQTALDSDIQHSIEELEQQLRDASVEESRRLYALLKEQRAEMEEDFESKLASVEEELRETLQERFQPEERTQVMNILNDYNSRVTAIQKAYIDQLDDLVYAEEMWEKAKRLQEEEILSESLHEEMKKKMRDMKNMVEEEKEEKQRILIEMQKRVNNLILRIDNSIRIFESSLVHQECQRAFIHLQNKAIQGGDITEEIGMLASKADEDPILKYLIQKIPQSIRISGVPSPVTYLVEFEALRTDARAASKTAEDASFAGQILGRTVASMVGTQGVDPEDPLVQIEKMNDCLMK